MSQTLFSRKALAPVLAAVAMAAGGVASAASLTEGFDGAGVPATWTALNVSNPLGNSGWFAGNTAVFGPQAGLSYIGANFQNTSGAPGVISNWLWTPSLVFNNGDVVSFYTRTTLNPSTYPDRLELRFSTGAVVNPVGATGTGSFTTLLLSVNPNLTATGYPGDWQQFTATISGLSGPTSGNVAFRYFVEDAGFFPAANSDYIGVDTFTITPVPEPATYGLMGLGIAGVLLAARRRKTA